MQRPRITIVVPTRDRCDTLMWALKTCVTQDYDNYEILVSDNASTDATRDVVGSYDDPRIRYINPGRRLGMSEHWEFALSHVTDGFIGVIGDDDGLLPSAIEDVAGLVGGTALPLVWPVQQYFWPTYPDPALANSVIMPLRQPTSVRELSSETSIRAVLRNSGLYPILPSPYFGVVPASIISAIRERSGSVFHSITPDIYAGFAVAAVCPTYLQSDRAYSLAGQSSHSNGASQLSGRGSMDPASPAAKFNSENALPFHPELVLAPSIPIVVTEAFMQTRDHLGLQLPVDLGHMISAALSDPLYVLNPSVRPSVDTALTQIAAKHGLGGKLGKEMSHIAWKMRWRFLREASLSAFFKHPMIECDPKTVANVYSASILVSAIRPRYESRYVGTTRRATARLSKVRRSLQAGLALLRQRSG